MHHASKLLMLTLVRPVQPPNAEPSMEVTEEGMVTEVRLVQLAKASLLMVVRPLGNIKLVTMLPLR